MSEITEYNRYDPSAVSPEDLLVVDLDGYEGPLDVLLALARKQKVDLTKLSILLLADQYISFIESAKSLQIELAADYLVMAAWLAYLKSRLLLPPDKNDDEPSGPELAARLQWQLRRLESMRDAAQKIMARDRLGKDIFPRGDPEGVKIKRNSVFILSLYDVLKAYSDFNMRGKRKPYTAPKPVLHSIDDAIGWLRRIIGVSVPKWELLENFLPKSFSSRVERKSALAAAFSATLELVKRGQVYLQQGEAFGPIYIKGNSHEDKNQE